MALEIRSIPVLTGEAAEQFLKAAEENERSPRSARIRFSMEDIQQIANSGQHRLKRMSDDASKS